MDNPFTQFIGAPKSADVMESVDPTSPSDATQASPANSTNSTNYFDAALAAEGFTGDQAELARSIYQQETASGKNVKTSGSGAHGPMQMMPATFRQYADKDWNIDDEEQNTRASLRYIKKLSDLTNNDPRLIAIGYYGGEGAIRKAQKNQAVSDPLNAKAPSTFQYADQVVGRLGKDKSLDSENPFTQFIGKESPPSEDKVPGEDESNPFDQFVGHIDQTTPIEKPREDGSFMTKAKEAAGELASVGDFALSLPGAIMSPMAAATGRWVAIAMGAQGDDVSKFGHEYGQVVAEKLSNPIHKVLDAVGVDLNYTDSGVNKALGKVAEIVQKGSNYLYEKANGKLTQEDADDLTNAASLLVAPAAIRMTSKAIKATGAGLSMFKKGGAEEVASVRESNAPAMKLPQDTPQDLVKRQIEETTGISKTKEVTPEYTAQREADARMAFSDDAQYNDYLRTYMKEEVAAPEVPVEIAADKLEQKLKAYQNKPQHKQSSTPKEDPYLTYLLAKDKLDSLPKSEIDTEIPSENAQKIQQDFINARNTLENIDPLSDVIPTWKEVLETFKKPISERTPEEVIQVRKFNGQQKSPGWQFNTSRGPNGHFSRQRGSVDPEMLAKMSAIGLGITGGIYLDPDNKFEGALLGLGGGYLAAKGVLNAREAATSLKSFFSPKDQIRITDPMVDHQTAMLKSARVIWQEQNKIFKNAPAPESRAKITRWLQGDKTVPLTDLEYAAAKDAKSYYERFGQVGVETGALTSLLDDYVNQQWDLEGTNKAAFAKLSTGMSESSSHNLRRKIASIEEGKKLGLKPVTEDIAQLMGMYGNSLTKTMSNIKLMDTLRETKDPETGIPLITNVEGAPKNYVPINKLGVMVHPDIKPSMDFMFQQRNPNAFLEGIRGVTSVAKRMNVMNPLFHIKNLGDVLIGSGHFNPMTPIKLLLGKHELFKQMREGGAGDIVDKAYEGGVIFTLEHNAVADMDAGANFYKTMGSVQKTLDDVIPGGGKIVEKFEKLNKTSDKFLWERFHAGGKVLIFSDAYDSIKRNNILAHERDPRVPLKSEKELTGIAGRYTNTLFGGMNWMRAAEEVKNDFLRKVALKAYSSGGRRILQDIFFAPDWKISTTQALVDAFGKGSGFKGLLKPQELADLHRRFLIRNAIYYTIMGNALNYALSGHSIYQNKDKTQLELSDGRSLQFSKHMMDPVHLMLKPGQVALSSLGVLPSEVIAQLTDKEYLSTKGAPPMDTSVAGRLRHVAKRFLPIGGSARDPVSFVAGNIGFPVAGRTPAQVKEDKQKARLLYKQNHAKKRPY